MQILPQLRRMPAWREEPMQPHTAPLAITLGSTGLAAREQVAEFIQNPARQ